MARKKKPHGKTAPPRNPPTEWIGGRLTLPFYVTEGEPFRPELILWVEFSTGGVVGYCPLDPAGPGVSVAEVLRQAMAAPLVGPPRRPARVRVADAELAAEITAAEPDLAVTVAPTPELGEVLAAMRDMIPAADGERPAGMETLSYFEHGRVSAAAVAKLFAAASLLFRAAPWQGAGDSQILRLDIPALGVEGACLSIIGALGESLGFIIFPDLAGFEAFLDFAEAGPPDEDAPLDLGTRTLSLNFERAADLPPTMRREAAEHGWPVAGPRAYPWVQSRDPDGTPRPLTEREVRIVSACATSLTTFFAKHGHLFQRESFTPVCESFFDEEDLEVRFTVPYDAAEIFEPLAAPGGLAPSTAPRGAASPPAHAASTHSPRILRRLDPDDRYQLLRDRDRGHDHGRNHDRDVDRDVDCVLDADEITLPLQRGPQVGRNEPCPCGSGKKYKKCCLDRDAVARDTLGQREKARTRGPASTPSTRGTPSTHGTASTASPMHQLDERLVQAMITFGRRYGTDWFLRAADIFADPDRSAPLLFPWAAYHALIDGRPLVDHYLEAEGRRLTAAERAWLAAQRQAWLSVWEVLAVETGRSLTLRDLLTGEERTVFEVLGSRGMPPRTALLARVVDHQGLSLLAGSHEMALPPREAASVVARARKRLRHKREVPPERLRDEGLGRRLIAWWENEAYGRKARHAVPPVLRNTDGEDLLFTVDHFSFDPAQEAVIAARLAALEEVEPPRPDEPDPAWVFLRPHPAGGDDGGTVLGRVTLAAGKLRLEANSIARADALRQRLEAGCGALLRHRLREHTDPIAQLSALAGQSDDPGPAAEAGPSPVPHPGARREPPLPPGMSRAAHDQLLRDFKERHYADWTDQPLPALGGQTPRETARTPEGRARVALLLKDMEYKEASFSPGERFDFSTIRRKLGLEEP